MARKGKISDACQLPLTEVRVTSLGEQVPLAVFFRGRGHPVGVVVSVRPGRAIGDIHLLDQVTFVVIRVVPGAVALQLVVRAGCVAGVRAIAVRVVAVRRAAGVDQLVRGIIAVVRGDPVVSFRRQAVAEIGWEW